MVYPYNGIVFRIKKEVNTGVYYNMNESKEHGKSQRQKPYIFWFRLYEMFQKGKFIIETESRSVVVPRVWIKIDENGLEGTVLDDENVLKSDDDDGCTNLYIY